jgi:hypothetical protein
MTRPKEYYNESGVQGYSCELLMTRGYNINYLEDILTTGYITRSGNTFLFFILTYIMNISDSIIGMKGSLKQIQLENMMIQKIKKSYVAVL